MSWKRLGSKLSMEKETSTSVCKATCNNWVQIWQDKASCINTAWCSKVLNIEREMEKSDQSRRAVEAGATCDPGKEDSPEESRPSPSCLCSGCKSPEEADCSARAAQAPCKGLLASVEIAAYFDPNCAPWGLSSPPPPSSCFQRIFSWLTHLPSQSFFSLLPLFHFHFPATFCSSTFADQDVPMSCNSDDTPSRILSPDKTHWIWSISPTQKSSGFKSHSFCKPSLTQCSCKHPVIGVWRAVRQDSLLPRTHHWICQGHFF